MPARADDGEMTNEEQLIAVALRRGEAAFLGHPSRCHVLDTTAQQGATHRKFARGPLQECAQSARRQSLPTEGRRDEIRHLHRIIDWAKLDCTNRLACGHSPERKRETRTGNPLVLKPLDNVDVMRVRLRPRLSSTVQPKKRAAAASSAKV